MSLYGTKNHSHSSLSRVAPESQDAVLEHAATHSTNEAPKNLPPDLISKLTLHTTSCKTFQNFRDNQVAVFESRQGDVFRLKLGPSFWEVIHEGPWKRNQVMEYGNYKLPLTGPTIDLLKRRMQDANETTGSKRAEQHETRHQELHKKRHKN